MIFFFISFLFWSSGDEGQWPARKSQWKQVRCRLKILTGNYEWGKGAKKKKYSIHPAFTFTIILILRWKGKAFKNEKHFPCKHGRHKCEDNNLRWLSIQGRFIFNLKTCHFWNSSFRDNYKNHGANVISYQSLKKYYLDIFIEEKQLCMFMQDSCYGL